MSRSTIARKKVKEKSKVVEFDNVNDPTVIIPLFNSLEKTRDKDFVILYEKYQNYIKRQLKGKLREKDIITKTTGEMMFIITQKMTDYETMKDLQRKFRAVELRDAARKEIRGEEDRKKDLGREMSRLDDIKDYLSKIKKVDVYYDIGSSEGGITRVIKKYFNSPTVYAFDINIKDEDTDDIHFRRNNPNEINRPPNSADLITVFMTLHHFDHFEEMMSELKRVLKPGGKLIIRDHDVSTALLANFFDFNHFMFNLINDEETPEIFSKTFMTKYKTKERWIELIEKSGFKSTIIEGKKWIYPMYRRKTGRLDTPLAFYSMFTKI